jgi:hypothetical protein
MRIVTMHVRGAARRDGLAEAMTASAAHIPLSGALARAGKVRKVDDDFA